MLYKKIVAKAHSIDRLEIRANTLKQQSLIHKLQKLVLIKMCVPCVETIETDGWRGGRGEVERRRRRVDEGVPLGDGTPRTVQHLQPVLAAQSAHLRPDAGAPKQFVRAHPGTHCKSKISTNEKNLTVAHRDSRLYNSIIIVYLTIKDVIFITKS